MFKSPSSPEEASLADRLRREALAARPEFSESLHQRLCRAVRARQAEGAVRTQRPGQRGGRRLFPAAAAAVLLAAALVTWGAFFAGRGTQLAGKISAPPQAARPPGDRDLAAIGELAEEANEQIADLLEQTAEWPQLARLDYWTSRAFSELRDRVPLDAAFSLALADTHGQPEPLNANR